MSNLDLDYLGKLVNRFKGYNSPTDTQKLLVMLAEKTSRDDKDNKKLAILIRAEKQAEKLIKARNEARDVVSKVNEEKRKQDTRKKIIWGSALKKASENEPHVAKLASWLYTNGYIAEKDKDAVRADYEAFITSLSSNNN